MRRNIPFSQRLFWSVFFIFLGFTGCLFIFQYQRETEFAQEKLDTVLKNYNYQLHYRVTHSPTLPVDSVVSTFLAEIPNKDIRVTIIDPQGVVIYDNSANGEMDNHNDREEIQKARRLEKSFSVRVSATTGVRYFYSASSINNYIYRTALPYDPYTKGILAINNDFVYFMALMVIIFLFVLSRYSLRIGQTVSKLRDFARNIRDVNQDDEEYSFPNDELGDISKQIVTLYHKQQKATNDLATEREKLVKHFQYSKEGFAMFTDDGQEILSNILYIQFAIRLILVVTVVKVHTHRLYVVHVAHGVVVRVASHNSAFGKKRIVFPVGDKAVHVERSAEVRLDKSLFAVLYPLARRVVVFKQPFYEHTRDKTFRHYLCKTEEGTGIEHFLPVSGRLVVLKTEHFFQNAAVFKPYAVEVAYGVPFGRKHLFGVQPQLLEAVVERFKAGIAVALAAAYVVAFEPEAAALPRHILFYDIADKSAAVGIAHPFQRCQPCTCSHSAGSVAAVPPLTIPQVP